MNKKMLGIGVMSLLAVVIAFALTPVLGQEEKKGRGEAGQSESAKGQKKAGGIPFRGKLAGVDKSAKTVTVGERTFQITPETRLMKTGKPATLADAVLGEEVGGSYKKTDDGKLVAGMVRFGPKPQGEPGGKKTGKQ